MSKSRWGRVQFVAIPKEWLWGWTPEYLDLSVPARMVYFCLKSGYLPTTRKCSGNNGHITYSYSALRKGSGFSSNTTIWRAINELEKKGWVRKNERGSIIMGPTKYELTGNHDPCM
jgi:hypothetical protein